MRWFSVLTAMSVLSIVVPGTVDARVLERVSVSTSGEQGNADSLVVGGRRVVTADGRYVVFTSHATNLVNDDTNGVRDVFVRDRWSGTTSRVSVDVDGGNGDGPSFDASISADGRYVVFTSAATDLVDGDRNWHFDIFVRDLWRGVTSRASVTPAGGDAGDDSAGGSISADGRHVAFVTWARMLAPGDTDWGPRDVIVRDMQLGENVLASISLDGGNPDEACWEAAIAGNGRHVAFVSSANNIVPGDGNTWMDAFVRDLDASESIRISVNSSGGDADNRNRHPRLSDDGRFVAFRSHASNLVAGDTNDLADIFVRDLTTGLTTRKNLSSAGEQAADGGSWFPDISGDGRYVVFLTDASNLFDDPNIWGDVVAHDRVTGLTSQLSVSVTGDQVDGWSNNPSVSFDGRYVVFESIATDMVPGDGNQAWDVFIATGPAPGPHLSIPAVARAQGSGAFFFSRLDAFNSSDRELTAEVAFTPRSDVNLPVETTTITVSPMQMVTIEDPLQAWFGIETPSAVGSLMFTVVDGIPEALELQSVVVARNPDGSEFGQSFPAGANGLDAGETAYLSATADPWRTRVNFGVMALLDGTQISVQPVGPIGSPLAAARFLLMDKGVSHQLNDIARPQVFDLGTTNSYLLEVSVLTGSAVVFSSLLDGTSDQPGSNDPTTVLPVTTGAAQVTLLELGSVQGLNEFSGSATISNLSPEPVTIQANFHLRGQPGVAQSTVMTLAGGATEGYGDIIYHLFTRSDVGALVLTVEGGGRIMATGREYSIERNPEGEIVATAGQLMPGMTDRDLIRPNRVYHLLGLRQRQTTDGTERSHFAAFNPGEQAVEIEIALFDGVTGDAEGAMSTTVRAGELVHVNNVIEKIEPQHGGRVKRLRITVSGELYLKGFRVNANGDPVTLDPLVE